MVTITFKEQFDKLTTAYINDEVEPYANCACFVGNLLNRNSSWGFLRSFNHAGGSRHLFGWEKSIVDSETIRGEHCLASSGKGMYTIDDLIHLENSFIKTFHENTVGPGMNMDPQTASKHPNYEEALFQAFVVALGELRKIHEAKGEEVDDFQFTKRQRHETTDVQRAI